MEKLCVSFDFDSTICGTEAHVPHVVQILKNHIRHHDEVIVLTARDPLHDTIEWRKANDPNRVAVAERLQELGLTLQVHYTSHTPKGPHAERLGVNIHYDNDPQEIVSCRACGVIAIPVGHEHENLVHG
jgi:hypothetical protein